MRISKLLQIWKEAGIYIAGDAELEFETLLSDTRQIDKKEKSIFFARRGNLFDGHQFLNEVNQNKNVLAIVLEKIPSDLAINKPCIQVRDSKLAMALAVKSFFQDPSRDLFCVAVTGTNGKTTSAYLLQHVLQAMKYPTAISGTIKTAFGEKQMEAQLTTPDFVELQAFMLDAKNSGAKAFSFEASSHALDQGRLLGIELDAALFTNLSSEHLDYHRSMEDYYHAKKKLFAELLFQSEKPEKIAVLPEDGAYGSQLIEEMRIHESVRIVRWSHSASLKGKDCLWIRSYESTIEGLKIQFQWEGQDFEVLSRLVGKFNVENLAGVCALALAKNFPIKDLIQAVGNFKGVPGRLERVDAKYSIFVDYAHTPDALENILSAIRPLCSGRLVVVFGCGGDRDKQKRPQMAQTVELYADELILTSDNPRTEDPGKILEDMLKGLQRVKTFQVEPDRRKAIQMGVTQLQKNDVLIIAGKGHEKYQQIGSDKLEFDDVKVAREFIR